MSNRLQNAAPGLGLLALAPVAASQRSAFGPSITPDEMAALLTQPDDDKPAYASAGDDFAEAHDLRAPVASILALVEQMLREDRGNSAVQRVKRHAQQLMAMVDGSMVDVTPSRSALGAEFSSH